MFIREGPAIATVVDQNRLVAEVGDMNVPTDRKLPPAGTGLDVGRVGLGVEIAVVDDVFGGFGEKAQNGCVGNAAVADEAVGEIPRERDGVRVAEETGLDLNLVLVNAGVGGRREEGEERAGGDALEEGLGGHV